MQALGDYEVVSFEELGLNELLAEGKPLGAAVRGCVVRACARLGIGEALCRATSRSSSPTSYALAVFG